MHYTRVFTQQMSSNWILTRDSPWVQGIQEMQVKKAGLFSAAWNPLDSEGDLPGSCTRREMLNTNPSVVPLLYGLFDAVDCSLGKGQETGSAQSSH